MKIAYIVPSLINQGPVVVVHSLVKYLQNKVERIDVYYFDEIKGLEFDCYTQKIEFDEKINFDNYDIIHSHGLRPDKYIIKWKKNIHKSRIITTLHQDTYASFKIKYNMLAGFLISRYWIHFQKQFDGVVTISNQLYNSYKRFFFDKLVTIYNGCDITINNNVDPVINNQIFEFLNKGYKTIGTYAFITKRKGLLQVIKALPSLPDYCFICIGNGPARQKMIDLSNNIGVSDRVLFIDYLKEPYKYLNMFDIYVMPSYSEGFGLAMVESALSGKAIVCSDIDSFHEILGNNDCSFFRLDDIDSLRDAIIKAFLDKDKLGQNAFDRASKYFTAEIMSNNYLNYYKLIKKS